MHLVEQYALACGVKIDKPEIQESYFPLECDKYITLHASSGMESKNYDFYNDVIELILPYLDLNGIKIIQIGGKEDNQIDNCIHHLGSTTIRQTAYIIKNSLLHFGNDSFSTHMASGYDKKIVSLYSILYKECCGPYWGNKENQILIESDRGGMKPSFSPKERLKTINLINPEEIACAVLDLLKIDHVIDKVETIHIGAEYHLNGLCVIPDHVMPRNFAPGQPANIWGHEHFDEQNIIHWISTRKCNLFIKNKIDIQKLINYRDNINLINYYVSLDDKPEYIEQLESVGIKVNLLSEEEKISDVRLKFFDWHIKEVKHKTKKDVDNIDLLCDNSFYKCSMKVLSNGKLYNSRAAWKHDRPRNDHRVIDCPEFWQDLNVMNIYNDNSFPINNEQSINSR